MSTIAFDQFALTRIADFARSLSRLHHASRRQLIEDDAIDREFHAVCMSVWGYTTDDFSDDLFRTPITPGWIRWMRRMRGSSRPNRVTTLSTITECSPIGGATAG